MARRRDNEAQSLSTEFRSQYEDYRAEYDIGGTGRYLPTPKGIRSTGSGADYHYENESKFFRAIERARHFDRNNMVIGQGVNRLAANLVQGDGFTLDVKTGDEKADKDLRDEWYAWCEDAEACDFEGERTFQEMELLAARTIPVDGDIFCLPLQDGHLQWIEAHRCRRPASSRSKHCIHGVNLDPDSAKRKSFYFTKEDIGPLGAVKTLQDVVEVQTRDDEGDRQVLQLYYPGRFSQRRGVTAFAPVALPIQYHDDIQFANLVAAQVQSCFAILEQMELSGVANPQPRTEGAGAPTGVQTTETLADGSTRTSQGMAPGMRIQGTPGWKLTGFSPTIPGPRYVEHALMILTIIAINLDLPVHVLLLDPSRTNFSGWRGAIEQARIRFRVMQRQLVNRFHTPVWKWFVRQRITSSQPLANLFKSKGDEIFGHTWNPPTWQYIEPLKDVQADTLEAASCGTSRRRQHARRGNDWKDIAPEIPEDNALLIRAAQRIAVQMNSEPDFADPKSKVTWRDLASLPMPDGVTFAMSPDKESGDSDPAGKQEPAE